MLHRFAVSKKAHIDADAFDMFIQFWCEESNWIYLMPLNAMLNKLWKLSLMCCYMRLSIFTLYRFTFFCYSVANFNFNHFNANSCIRLPLLMRQKWQYLLWNLNKLLNHSQVFPEKLIFHVVFEIACNLWTQRCWLCAQREWVTLCCVYDMQIICTKSGS